MGRNFLPETRMTDTDPAEEATLFPKSAGERLRDAREAQGLSLAEIASRTRIPIRQLEAVETSNFAALPSITYSVGFAKAYARAVGVDEVAIAREIRGQNDQAPRRTDYEAYEVTEASRVPTRGLAMTTLVVALLALIAGGLWYGTSWFRGESAQPAAETAPAPQAAPVAAPSPKPITAGQVTLTATDEVWMRVYDATGKTLFEKTLKPGDHYDVPGDANNPMINVGRPDQLQVTVNGSAVPALGDGKVAIKDVPISGAALLARASGTPQPAPAATSTKAPAVAPTPGATPTTHHAAARPRHTDSAPAAAATAAPPPAVTSPPVAVPAAATGGAP
jgi:cytoskeletal protein RodZ